MKTLNKWRDVLHERILELRSVENIITHPRFGLLWLASEPEQLTKVKVIIAKGDKKALLKWLKEHPAISVEEMSLRQLLDVAQGMGIKNYSRLTKFELVKAIKVLKENGNKTGDDSGDVGLVG